MTPLLHVIGQLAVIMISYWWRITSLKSLLAINIHDMLCGMGQSWLRIILKEFSKIHTTN